MSLFCAENNSVMQGELKLTVLISWESGQSVIQSHAAALPDRPQPPVKVQVKSSQLHTGVNNDNQSFSAFQLMMS